MKNYRIIKDSKSTHSKLSAAFIKVEFSYGDEVREWVIPIVDKYTGVNFDIDDSAEVHKYLTSLVPLLDPAAHQSFRESEADHWALSNSEVTKPIFEKLISDFGWYSYADLSNSSNPARRIQDLRQQGYTIATRPFGRGIQMQLLPIPRKQGFKYEYWSSSLRKRIFRVLSSLDAFEGKVVPASHLLPDHKFPEIRWGAMTARENLETLSDDELREEFQLINNQRNQQKREVCRACFQTDVRPSFLGITFFSEGSTKWDPSIPRTGEEAKRGCRGCPWFDIDKWRQSLNENLNPMP